MERVCWYLSLCVTKLNCTFKSVDQFYRILTRVGLGPVLSFSRGCRTCRWEDIEFVCVTESSSSLSGLSSGGCCRSYENAPSTSVRCPMIGSCQDGYRVGVSIKEAAPFPWWWTKTWWGPDTAWLEDQWFEFSSVLWHCLVAERVECDLSPNVLFWHKWAWLTQVCQKNCTEVEMLVLQSIRCIREKSLREIPVLGNC